MEAVLGCNTLRGLQPAGQTARSDIQVQVECSKHIVVERELVLVRAVTSRARHTDKRTNRCSSAAECEGCTSFPVRVLGRSILSRTRSCRRVGKAVNAAHATAAAIYVWCAVQVPSTARVRSVRHTSRRPCICCNNCTTCCKVQQLHGTRYHSSQELRPLRDCR
jgi:hypothetical protein